MKTWNTKPNYCAGATAKKVMIVALLCFNVTTLLLFTTSPAEAHCKGYHPHHCKPKDVVDSVKKTFETVATEVDRCINKKGCDASQADLDVWSELIGEGGRALYPGAAATMEIRHAGSTKYGLDYWQQRLLRPYFGNLVDRVRIVYNARLTGYLGSFKGVTIDMPGFTPAGAQTFGHMIYIGEGKSDSFEQLMVLAHELVHASQYEGYGRSFSDFGYHYFKSYAKNGFVYEKISLEVEAYKKENELRDPLKEERLAGLGGVITSGPVVAINRSSRLEVFAQGTDGALWHIYQTSAGGGWSDWSSLGGTITSNIAVGINHDGTLEVFAQGTDRALWHIYQTSAGGGWSGWSSLGGTITSNIAVGINHDGALEVFAQGTDRALWHIYQTSAGGGWSGWYSLGGVIASGPAIGQNPDGTLKVFVRSRDNTLRHR